LNDLIVGKYDNIELFKAMGLSESKMQINDWNERWEKNQIGFHEHQPNLYLTSYLERFNVPKKATVFVPLCGKSNDLFWLAQQGYQVVGIECSAIAVEDFFKQHQLEPNIQSIEHFKVYRCDNITIYLGDFFKLDQTHLERCDLIYDRASMVAFPERQRDQYVAHLSTWLSASTPLFLITLSYDQNVMAGPPFSVQNHEVERHYQHKDIQQIHQKDVIDEGPRWRKVGLNSLIETAFKIN